MGTTTRDEEGDIVASADAVDSSVIQEGTLVEVRDHFTGAWAVGFVVWEVRDETVQVCRLRDGAVIPWWFPLGEARCTARTSGCASGRTHLRLWTDDHISSQVQPDAFETPVRTTG
jgi:hypothetical protein